MQMERLLNQRLSSHFMLFSTRIRTMKADFGLVMLQDSRDYLEIQ